jgi:penicillin-binding protein 1B
LHTRGFAFAEQQRVPAQVLRLQFSDQRISSLASTLPSANGSVQLEPMVIGGIYPSQNEDRVLIQLKEAPPHLVDALIATEDQRFYHHIAYLCAALCVPCGSISPVGPCVRAGVH